MALIDVLILTLFALSAQLWTITDSVERCKRYSNPKHGRMVCDSLFRLFCAPECDNGFVFEFKPAVVYMCGPLTGEWFTYPEGEKIPWPDCVKRKSSEDNKEDDITARRAQIAEKIHQTHQGIFRNNYQIQPVQTGQPNARYLHLFDYIQRAQQMYNYDKQAVSTLGYHALQLEQQKQQQLKVQQQQQQRQKQLAEQLKQKQQEMQQQLQSRTHAMQMQKLRHQQETFQREMVDKQRQQREAFELANMNDYNQQGLSEPQFKPWRYDANQNPQDKFQSSWRVHSKPVSHRSGATLSTFYPEMSQKLYERYPTYRTIPTNYKGNSVATGELNQQQINPAIKTYSVNSLKRSDLSTSSGNDIQVLESRERVTENVPPSLSRTVISPTWRRSGLNRVLQNSDTNFTNLTLQPVKHNHGNVYSLTANEITSTEVDVKPTSQSQDSTLLQKGNLPHAPPNKEATPLPLQKAEGQIQQFSVKPAIYMFQTKTEGTPSMQSKSTLNVTSQVEKRGDVDDKTASQPQKKSARKEKLFYFPIKRDTLISLLPMHLQEKYRSLRDTRNVNSSYEASISKNKVNSTVKMEDIKLQNLSKKVDPPTSISSYNYSVQQIKTGNDSITEYFYLPSHTTAEIINSTSVNSSVNEEDLEKASIESKNGTIAPS